MKVKVKDTSRIMLSCQDVCGMNGCGNIYCSNHRKYIPERDRNNNFLIAAQYKAAEEIAARYYKEKAEAEGKLQKKRHPKRHP